MFHKISMIGELENEVIQKLKEAGSYLLQQEQVIKRSAFYKN